jgi:putative aldouronate transport system permease protein
MMYLVLFAMLFPAGLIPWFLVINDLGMLDTMWALVIPSALSPWHVILLANFFGDIPPEMEEAAVVDGANQWTVLTRIYVPLSGPAIATMVLLSSVLQWNSWFDGQVLMSTAAKYPLQTYLRLIIVESNAIRQAVGAEGLASISNRGFRGAAIVLTTLPILFVYPFIQKYFMTGMRLGAIKG